MAEPFVAEIRIVGFNFAPQGWALCNGQLLPISQNTALFSLVGTFYGGDGKTTFGLPNFQGNSPVHSGQLAGGELYDLGQTGGVPAVTLITPQMPGHNHTAMGVNGVANQEAPAGNTWAGAAQRPYAPSSNTQMNGGASTLAGGSQPHDNMAPYLVMNFIIALQGIYPARN